MISQKLRIGINCININPAYVGGINSFTFWLLDGFAKINIDHKIILFVAKDNEHLFSKYLSSAHIKIITVKNPPRFLVSIEWNSLKLHSKTIYKHLKNLLYQKQTNFIDKNCDVLYTPTTVLYSYNSKVPNVLSMHDIQHIHFNHFFTKSQLLTRYITYELSARHADILQASSHFIKDDFLKHFSFLRKNQIAVINECVNCDAFQNSQPLNIKNKYQLPDDYIFYPAQLWPHKNHITLLRALKKLEQNGIIIPLVLTGIPFHAKDDLFGFIKKERLKDVFYLGKVPFEDIIGLYKTARILITTSLHESSSLPILEAAAAKIPIVASTIPPNIEMAENLKLNLFETTNAGSLAEMILKVWNNKELNKKQVMHNNEKLAEYSCENIAKKYIELFENIVK